MIKYGEMIAQTDMEQLRSSAMGKADYIDRFLPLAAELQLRRSNVPNLIAPLSSQEDVLPSLTDDPERQEQLTRIQEQLAAKFSTDDKKLKPSNFGIVQHTEISRDPETGKPIRTLYHTVILSKKKGLARGTYNEIMDGSDENRSKYIIEVDGQEYDTRDAMILGVARAMGLRSIALYAAVTDPDSRKLRPVPKEPKDYKPQTATWLTGDTTLVQADVAPCAPHTLNPNPQLRSRTGRWSAVGFRPGVSIKI